MTRTVLQLVGPSSGGIRRHVAALTDDLRTNGWRVVVAAPAGVLEGAEHIDVPTGLSVSALRRARRQLSELIDDVRPDVVHAHGLKAGWVAVGVDRGITVLTVHNVVLGGGPRSLVLRPLERSVIRQSARVIATSHEIARRFADVSTSIAVVEPVHEVAEPTRPGRDVREELGAHGPLVVSVARLHAQKSLDVLVRAGALVAQRHADVRVVIAGEGPDRSRLEGLIADLGLGDVVRLLGARDDAIDLMSAADVVAFTSSWESGPLTLLEAGSVSAAVVSTPVGFVPDMVEPGRSGILVPVGDVGATAAAIMECVEDPTAARGRGDALRRAVLPRLDRSGPLSAVESVYAAVIGDDS
jgi:glycosyltransferase involved in cell wall biosynthesis